MRAHLSVALASSLSLLVLGPLGCGGGDDDPPAQTEADTGGDTRVDTGVDSGSVDSGTPDTEVTDTGMVDTGLPETMGPPDGLTPAEWTQLKTLGPLPAVPKDTTNAYADNAKAAVLGQMLFFDKSYSGALAVGDDGTNGGLGAVGDTGKVSCASCHEGVTMDDSRSKPNNVSLGTDFGTRNSPSIVNSSFYAWTNWGGRFDSQWALPTAVAENPKIMNSHRMTVARMLYAKYRTEYDAIFPVPLDARLDPANAMAFGAGKAGFDALGDADKAIINRIHANYGKALAAYMRLLVSRDAPFDKYVAGKTDAIGADAKRGMKIFIGKGACISCHSGPNFADDKFHALAVPQTGPKVPAADLGRFTDITPMLASPFSTAGEYSDDKLTGKLTGLVADPSMKGQFRTKSLRGVADSASYMHSGQQATLDEVIAYYGKGGDAPPADVTKDPLMKPFALDGTDKADLVAFLKTLSGAPVSAALRTSTAK